MVGLGLMPRESDPPQNAPAASRARAWVRLGDEELLKVRLCDLNLTVEDSRLARPICAAWLQRTRRPRHRLQTPRLARRGMVFAGWRARHCRTVLPGASATRATRAAHDALGRRRRNTRWLMRILRHEAGHALDNAYRLRRRASWREMFDPASLPYPERYRARPGESALRPSPR